MGMAGDGRLRFLGYARNDMGVWGEWKGRVTAGERQRGNFWKSSPAPTQNFLELGMTLGIAGGW